MDERGWWDRAWHDLVWGARCVGCGQPGPVTCAPCRVAAAAVPHVRDELRFAPFSCTSSAEYAGYWRRAVSAHKDDGVRALAVDLAAALGRAVEHELAALPAPAPGEVLLLVPAPSSARTVRARGDDPWLRVVKRAAAQFRRSGRRTMAAPLLHVGPGVADQAGLDVRARAQNLAGRVRLVPRRLVGVRRVAPGPVRVVVCDDVVTTGATLRECVRALRVAGVPVDALATVAATVRRDALRGRSWRPG